LRSPWRVESPREQPTPIEWPLFVGNSPELRAVVRQIEKIARSDASVVIQGETGSGKELAARAIRVRSARRTGPFVAINCGAIPDGLIETELFGHSAGAFTDARQSREGVIALAHRGTLFLDEVDTLSPKAQVALLRFLQDFRYRPVGLSSEVAANVRVIVATNQRLESLVEEGRFRRDLLYRLNILELTIPPLRSRHCDIDLLAQHFLGLFCRQYGLPPKRFHPDTSMWLHQHDWPGNVRELENWVHRHVLLADDPEIRIEDRPTASGAAPLEDCGDNAPGNFRAAKARAVAEFESAYLRRVLAAAHGNVTAAARIAGKERRSFGRLLRKHRIDRGQFDS
jgi:two-component system, NtrC family, response regulator GlrR